MIMNKMIRKKSQVKLLATICVFALLDVVMGAITESPPQQQQEQQQQQQQRNLQTTSSRSYRIVNRNGLSRASNAPPPTCENKELIQQLNDRVGILATLDENQRDKLEAIDKKMDNLLASNEGRMESLRAQQTDFQQRLNSFEHIQRLSRNTLDELKGETDQIFGSRLVRELKHKKRNRQKLNGLSRPVRQVDVYNKRNQSDISVNVPERLDALASLITSTAFSVNDLQKTLTKLLVSNNLLRRRLGRRRGQGNKAPAPLPEFSTSCYDSAFAINGILKLKLTPQSESFYVVCDEDWTVIMNRGSGNVNFQRGWVDYKDGFGNLAGDFFIGLDKLHALTASNLHELRIVLEDFQGNVAYASYSAFAIGNEKEAYPLSILGEFINDPQPTAGDSLSYQAGAKFSTIDNDNDNSIDSHCAQKHKAGGWFNNCATSNLFGVHYTNGAANAGETGIFWEQFQGLEYSLKHVKMLIRPIYVDADV